MEETRPRRVRPRRHQRGRLSLFVCTVLACGFLTASDHSAPAAEPEEPKNVLVLYSFSEQGLFDSLDRLKSEIRSRLKSPVNFYVHYMEAQGLGDPSYESVLSETLRDELDGVHLDLLIAAAYPALGFAVTYRDHFSPGVPVLFSYVHDGRLQGAQLWPGVTGVTISIGVRDTLELSFRLHPGTQNLAILTGTSEFERYWLAEVRDEFRRYADKMKLIEIVRQRNEEILRSAALLPPNTVVLFQVIPRDSTQPELGLYDTIRAIAQSFPTYCILANYCIGHGGIGGSYADYAEQSLRTGEIAARLLSGEKPENIPVVHGSAARPNVDWRQLRRWNISESALPAGTVVLFRQPTVWGRYQNYILLGVAVILLQTLLIGALLVQRARGRSATEDLRRLGGLLIHAQEEERSSIARELHDHFIQRLALQCIELTHLEKDLPESAVEQRASAKRMLTETKEMSADIRSLSHQLHSSRLELVGLLSALRGLCDETSKSYNVTVSFTEPEVLPNLTKDKELCLFRVTQEALSNMIKHSQASGAHVELVATANSVSLRIWDEGKGFDPDLKNAGGGIGLMGMQERLRLVGGSLSIRTQRTRGTEVLAEIPVPHSEKESGGAYAA